MLLLFKIMIYFIKTGLLLPFMTAIRVEEERLIDYFLFYFFLILFLKKKSSAGKESTCNVGDLGLIPGLGRSPGEGKGYHSSIVA